MKIASLPRQLSDLRPLLGPLWTALRRIVKDRGERPATIVEEMEANLRRNLGPFDKRDLSRMVVRLARLALGFDPLPGRRFRPTNTRGCPY